MIKSRFVLKKLDIGNKNKKKKIVKSCDVHQAWREFNNASSHIGVIVRDNGPPLCPLPCCRLSSRERTAKKQKWFLRHSRLGGRPFVFGRATLESDRRFVSFYFFILSILIFFFSVHHHHDTCITRHGVVPSAVTRDGSADGRNKVPWTKSCKQSLVRSGGNK